MVIGLTSMFSMVRRAFFRNGITQYELNALPGFTHTASDVSCEYFPQPIAKKSPSGTSTDGSFSSSQYMRTIEYRQLPVGVIQMCWIAPDPAISPSVNVVPAGTTMNGLTFQPCP